MYVYQLEIGESGGKDIIKCMSFLLLNKVPQFKQKTSRSRLLSQVHARHAVNAARHTIYPHYKCEIKHKPKHPIKRSDF